MSDKEWYGKVAVIEYKKQLAEKIKDGIGTVLFFCYIAHLIEVITR